MISRSVSEITLIDQVAVGIEIGLTVNCRLWVTGVIEKDAFVYELGGVEKAGEQIMTVDFTLFSISGKCARVVTDDMAS